MTISVWRYSHLALAISSFLFIALAAITGSILAFQPVSEKLASHKVQNFESITVAQAVSKLKAEIPGVTDIYIDANQNVILKGTDKYGKKILAYADPLSGKAIATVSKPNQFFQWVTALHRSLFLHEAGRIFVGITSFLLLLIAITGLILVIKRQRSFRRFFGKIVKENFAQYYHVALGRLSLIPIIIIALTGTWLSFSKLGYFAEQKVRHNINTDAIPTSPQLKPADFTVFKNLKLADVQQIEFPFSEFPEDYYKLKLRDRELIVNQVNGGVLSEIKYPLKTIAANFSLDLHTGRTNAIWAVVLALASINILFFIWSGFVITLNRRKNKIAKNKFTAAGSKFIILVGSENGTTFKYANELLRQLLKQGKKAYLAELKDYTVFPQATHLIVMTATYGLGDAPTNAVKFIELLERCQQTGPIMYAVLGFGSHAYPDFCKYAFEINQAIANQSWASALVDIHTINDQSPSDINLWTDAWSQQTGIMLSPLFDATNTTPKNLAKFRVVSQTGFTENNRTFLLRLLPLKHLKITSGDLLAIYPANDHRERLYSIGLIGNEIQLSIRLHDGGLGSTYLHRLSEGEILNARIVSNTQFHFPAKAKTVVMIANGTGVAPFLGMVNQNPNRNIHLYCGFRDSASYGLYESGLSAQYDAGLLKTLRVALSRESDCRHVTDMINEDINFIGDVLRNNGVLMICGSLAMQKDVLGIIEAVCEGLTGKPLSYFQSHSQILTDCY